MKPIKADLHNHLKTGSYMPEGIFNRAINIARERLGENGIVGLVNFEDRRYENFSGLRGYERQDLGNAVYVPEKEILIVRGQEVPTKEGHLLVLGMTKDVQVKSGRSLEDTMKEAKDNNGILIADHPFYNQGIGKLLMGNPLLLGELDGFEVHNGESALWIPRLTQRGANEKAQIFYTQKKIEWLAGHKLDVARFPMAISTSDGHSLYEIGKSYTVLDSEPVSGIANSDGIVRALKNAFGNSSYQNTVSRGSKIGGVDHIVDLALIIAFSKLGINLKKI